MAAAVDLFERHKRAKVKPAEGPPDAIPMAKLRATPVHVNKTATSGTPPLTIQKRISSQEPAMSSFAEKMLKATISALNANDLDAAENYLNQYARMEKRGDVHIHNYGNGVDDDDDDEDNGNGMTVEDDWSEAADAKSKWNNASLKSASNNNGNGVDDEDDEEDDEVQW
jgi:hypothetical protein